jgi:hypothetical protein
VRALAQLALDREGERRLLVGGVGAAQREAVEVHPVEVALEVLRQRGQVGEPAGAEGEIGEDPDLEAQVAVDHQSALVLGDVGRGEQRVLEGGVAVLRGVEVYVGGDGDPAPEAVGHPERGVQRDLPVKVDVVDGQEQRLLPLGGLALGVELVEAPRAGEANVRRGHGEPDPEVVHRLQDGAGLNEQAPQADVGALVLHGGQDRRRASGDVHHQGNEPQQARRPHGGADGEPQPEAPPGADGVGDAGLHHPVDHQLGAAHGELHRAAARALGGEGVGDLLVVRDHHREADPVIDLAGAEELHEAEGDREAEEGVLVVGDGGAADVHHLDLLAPEPVRAHPELDDVGAAVDDARRVVVGAGGLVGQRGEGASHAGGALPDDHVLVVGVARRAGTPGHQQQQK